MGPRTKFHCWETVDNSSQTTYGEGLGFVFLIFSGLVLSLPPVLFSFFWQHHMACTEKAMAPRSSTLAWKIPWTEEPGRCSPWGRKELDTTEQFHFHFSLSCIGEGNGNPLQCSCLQNPRDGGAWWAAVYGVTQSQTRLPRLSSSSILFSMGFAGGSDGKESAYNAGDLGSIPRLGRSQGWEDP